MFACIIKKEGTVNNIIRKLDSMPYMFQMNYLIDKFTKFLENILKRKCIKLYFIIWDVFLNIKYLQSIADINLSNAFSECNMHKSSDKLFIFMNIE